MAATGVPQLASLYVGDLNPDVTEAMLYEIFNSVGPVGSIRVCRDSVSRRSLGYAYVNYHNVPDAEQALATLNYSSIKGRACRIMWSQRDPSSRKNAKSNIVVKNLDRNIDNKALFDTFGLFGKIVSCKVACDSNGKSRGYGFVHFELDDAAQQAIERVNGMQIGERTVEVARFQQRDERESTSSSYTNLYVKNVPNDFDEDKLKAMFEPYGTITSSIVMEDKKSRKFCFVNFETTEAAQKAVEELNGKDQRTDEQKESQKDGEEPELLYVGRAMTKAERAKEFSKSSSEPGSVNLYVKNLDEDTDDAKLRELFEHIGTISSAVAMRDDKGKCKGFGFVCFASTEDATKAVTEMHLKVVNGKPLYVGLAEQREARQERLRQRYQPSPGGGGMGKGAGGGGKGMGKNGMGGMGGMPGPMGMGGMGPGMGGLGPQAMRMGSGGMGGPQMMMGAKGGCGMMCGPMAMMGGGGCGMPGAMCGKGGSMGGMPGNSQAMMGGKPGMMMPPQMMAMMGKGGMMGGMPGPMGMMRPMMPSQQQPPQQRPPQPQPAAPDTGGLTATALAAATPSAQKQMLGEKLYPLVMKVQPQLAGKITGMMLEMDNSELLLLLESEQAMRNKVFEAMRVIEQGSA